jgi:hypothetical protein
VGSSASDEVAGREPHYDEPVLVAPDDGQPVHGEDGGTTPSGKSAEYGTSFTAPFGSKNFGSVLGIVSKL